MTDIDVNAWKAKEREQKNHIHALLRVAKGHAKDDNEGDDEE